jgi:iron complex outermembrane recepter protein
VTKRPFAPAARTSRAAAAFVLVAMPAAAASEALPPATGAEAPVSVAQPGPVPETGSADEIVVTAGRPRGSVVSDIQADVTLSPADIRAYGASSLADLLQQLSPQTRSGRGRGGDAPVVLINGRRVSGFAEIRNIPPEAIQRVEVLPEETALAYGYRADQRVVNFILRERFQAFTGEVEVGGPTAGGRRELELDGTILRLEGDNRLLVDIAIANGSALLESQRSILQSEPPEPLAIGGNVVGLSFGAEIDPALSALAGVPVTVAAVPRSAANSAPTLADFAAGANQPNTTDVGQFRTLIPETSEISAGASIARPIGTRTQVTLSARAEANSSESRLGLAETDLTLPTGNPFSPFGQDSRLVGLASAPGPLIADRDSWSGRVAAAFNGDISSWRWSLTASHDHEQTRTLTDRSIDLAGVQARLDALDPSYNPFAPNAVNGPVVIDRATSNLDRSLVEAVVNGRIADLPAGGLATTFKVGLDNRDLESRSSRNGIGIGADLNRTQYGAQGSIDVPLTSRRREVLGAIGDISVNANASVDHLSDFGTLTVWGAGVTWRPVVPLQLIGSFTREEGAPSIQQLGNPLVATPNVRVFDYARGETVEITRIDGGNPNLGADSRQVWKLGGRLNPIPETDLSLQADYVHSRITGPISPFPSLTAEIEAAFPERFRRDSDGRLLQIDSRPVNFARSERSELRWGINFSERLEPSKAEREAMARRRAEFEKMRAEAQASGKPGAAASGLDAAAPVRPPGRSSRRTSRWRPASRSGPRRSWRRRRFR